MRRLNNIQTKIATLSILIACSVFILYARAGSYEFINFDDFDYVLFNDHVKNGLTWTGFQWAFRSLDASNWHPLTWLSHMLDVTMFGMDAGRHHLVNIFFHALSSSLLFIVLFRMTGSVWKSAFTAALFAVHPLHVESVSWIAERKDVLSGFFFMLVLLFYERYARRATAWRYSSVLLFYALGLMSKPMLVTTPFVLLLLDIWPLGRTEFAGAEDGVQRATVSWSRLVIEKAPLFLLTTASAAITYIAQLDGRAVMTVGVLPMRSRLANAAISYGMYLEKTIWPSSLSIFYPIQVNDLSSWRAAGSILLLLSITILALRWIRQRTYFAVGWFWYLGMLVPVIGLVQVGVQAMADRYSYLSMIGIYILVTWYAVQVFSKNNVVIRKVLIALSGSVLVVFSALTMKQVSYWQNNERIFMHAAAVTENNWVAYCMLGDEKYAQGNLEDALWYYQTSLKNNPLHAKSHYGIGVVFYDLGQFDQAIYHFQEAINRSTASRSTAQYHSSLGSALLKSGLLQEAVWHYEEALRIDPDNADFHFNIGTVLNDLGRIDEAIDHYRRAIRTSPGKAKYYNNFGNSLAQIGRLDEAIANYREAIRIEPGYELAQKNLQRILAGRK